MAVFQQLTAAVHAPKEAVHAVTRAVADENECQLKLKPYQPRVAIVANNTTKNTTPKVTPSTKPKPSEAQMLTSRDLPQASRN